MNFKFNSPNVRWRSNRPFSQYSPLRISVLSGCRTHLSWERRWPGDLRFLGLKIKWKIKINWARSKISKSRLIENNLDFVTLILAQFVWIYHLIFNPKKCKMHEKNQKKSKKNFIIENDCFFILLKVLLKEIFKKLNFEQDMIDFIFCTIWGYCYQNKLSPKSAAGALCLARAVSF